MSEDPAYIAAFNAGYLIACCNVQNLHDEPTIASDVLAELGLKASELEAMDLTEYDAAALAEIRAASRRDPIIAD